MGSLVRVRSEYKFFIASFFACSSKIIITTLPSVLKHFHCNRFFASSRSWLLNILNSTVFHWSGSVGDGWGWGARGGGGRRATGGPGPAAAALGCATSTDRRMGMGLWEYMAESEWMDRMISAKATYRSEKYLVKGTVIYRFGVDFDMIVIGSNQLINIIKDQWIHKKYISGVFTVVGWSSFKFWFSH